MRVQRAVVLLSFFLGCKSHVAATPSEDSKATTTTPRSGGVQQILQVKGATLSVPWQTSGNKPQLTGTVRPSGIVGISQIYSFGPDGTTFDPPAVLTIQLDSSDQVGAAYGRVALHEPDGTWQSIADSQPDPARRRVTASVSHFTEYAVVSNSLSVAGTGTAFSTPTTTLTTTTPITASMRSGMGLIEILVEKADAQTASLAGLIQDHDYYVYHGAYANGPTVVHSNDDGELVIAISGVVPMLVRVQPNHGTVFLALPLFDQCTGVGGIRTSSGCTLCPGTVVGDSVEILNVAPYALFCPTADQTRDQSTSGGCAAVPETDTVPTAEISGKNFSGVGVDLFGADASVIGCSISGFSDGVDMSGASDSVSNVTITNVETGISVSDSAVDARINGVTAKKVILDWPIFGSGTSPIPGIFVTGGDFNGAFGANFEAGLTGNSIIEGNTFSGLNGLIVGAIPGSGNFSDHATVFGNGF